jgi:hypothetical protein
MMGGSESIQDCQSGRTFGALLPTQGIANIIGWDLPFQRDRLGYPTRRNNNPGRPRCNYCFKNLIEQSRRTNQTILDAFMANSIWQPLSAVANGKVFILPGNAAPGNMSLLNMLQTTAEIIYAEGF